MKMVLASVLTTVLIVAMTLGAMFILVEATDYVTSLESTLQRAVAIVAELLLGVVLLLITAGIYWNYYRPPWKQYQSGFRSLITRQFGEDRAKEVPSGIQQVWVEEGRRGEGLGRALVEAAIPHESGSPEVAEHAAAAFGELVKIAQNALKTKSAKA